MTRSIALLIGLALCSPPDPAASQTSIGLSTGANATSSLLRDSIVEAFTVRAKPAPTLGFWIETRLDARYSVSLGLATSWGRLARYGTAGAVDVVPLSTWSPTLRLQRTVSRSIQAYAKMGAIVYRADRTGSNLFREGAPPAPMLGVGLRAEHLIASGIRLVVDLGYDAHRFSTPAMRTEGFRGEQLVHRVALGVGVSRGL